MAATTYLRPAPICHLYLPDPRPLATSVLDLHLPNDLPPGGPHHTVLCAVKLTH